MDQSDPIAVEFASLLERVHLLGREVIAPKAAEVDRDARFPREAFDALRNERLLSAYVPQAQGGLGLNIVELAQICEVLGQYCASTAMIFAMHQIQVGCLVHHALRDAYFEGFLRELAERQLLLASATTELGIGGDIRNSICFVKREVDRFSLEKQAPVISYGAEADGILVTARRDADAARSDQVQVLLRKADYTLKPLSGWDTLGFRGTCSLGFSLSSSGAVAQILPEPYADIHSVTMQPFAHIVWGSLWTGLASDALNRARGAVRAEARRNPQVTPISATRLAEADIVLFQMRSAVHNLAREYLDLLRAGDRSAFGGFGFAIKTNNLKLTASHLVVDIVGRAMLIGGIASYRNDSSSSLGRHLRDAYGAALMVNNDRILGHNATMHIAQREG